MENLVYILFTFGYFLIFGIFGIKCIRLFYICNKEEQKGKFPQIILFL